MYQTSRILRLVAAALLLALVAAACGSSSTPSPSASAKPSANGSVVTPNPSVPNASNGPIASKAPINGMTCDSATHTGGVTAKVTFTLDDNGATLSPTANIGVLADCKYWVYSDANGGLLVDAPAGASVTLGDFVTIWRLTNPNDPVFVKFVIAMSGASHSITVNGSSVAGDKWQNMPLTDGMKIVAQTTTATAPPASSPSPSAS